ncbi:MAG: hypothetical protein B7Y25_01395 [Alphaproteobacteria bacterium 16-39-46]|nr:MAG: hypothetical protein B7Y25_01395 [Alphaproteobacteria bacterium 16-39-46]OZA44070.1 MAG: hypothetical protein B7X84_01380 [Alphaproteobacteria bacterium 17-39-52]HQS83586.1 transposase [Alphaproteobacteria bacterium]HQS93375.1 transposase [Alphaproteobacteria bacterium]
MTNYNERKLETPAQKGRKIEINFGGGSISCDGGILLLNQIDKKLGLTQKISCHLKEYRDPTKVQHSFLQVLRQRVYGIALGYEDLNDYSNLRQDRAFQTSVSKDTVLASSSTLCRFENKAKRSDAVMIHQEMIEQFITSFKSPPKELILDFDATDDLIHGEQVGTIRLKLLKIGVVITRNTRRIRFSLSEHYPLKDLFFSLFEKLQAT